MKLLKQSFIVLFILIMIMGVCGCMVNNKQISAERVHELAMEYLNSRYEDTFIAEGYTSSNWAYEYSCITFKSQKFSEIIEVRAYKNRNGLYTFKDNYYQLYMKSDATEYFSGLVEGVVPCTIKIRFPNSFWSDELDKIFTFDEWVCNGSCNVDVFFITNDKWTDNTKVTIVNRIALDKISGSISFLETKDGNMLNDYKLDEVLNNQNILIESEDEYFINFDHEIEK